MQTDAFELITKDPNLRALAASPGFQAVASQPQVMAAVMANPQAFASLAANPAAFKGVAQAAQSLQQAAPAARAQNAGMLAGRLGSFEGGSVAGFAAAGPRRDSRQSGRLCESCCQCRRVP